MREFALAALAFGLHIVYAHASALVHASALLYVYMMPERRCVFTRVT